MVSTHGWKTIKHGSSADQREFQEPGLGRPDVPSPFRQLPRQTHEFVLLFSELEDTAQLRHIGGIDVNAVLLEELIGGLTGTESDEITLRIDGEVTHRNLGLPEIPDDVFPWDTDEDGELYYDDSAPTHLLHPRELGIKPLSLCVGTTGQVDCTHGYWTGDDEDLGDISPLGDGFIVRDRP